MMSTMTQSAISLPSLAEVDRSDQTHQRPKTASNVASWHQRDRQDMVWDSGRCPARLSHRDRRRRNPGSASKTGLTRWAALLLVCKRRESDSLPTDSDPVGSRYSHGDRRPDVFSSGSPNCPSDAARNACWHSYKNGVFSVRQGICVFC